MKLGQPHICILQWGHYGDVIAMLPIAYHLHQQGKIVHWFLYPESKRDIFRACSYVRPVDITFESVGDKNLLRQMIAMASERFSNVLVCSLKDKAQGGFITQSYNRENWRLAGFLSEWDNPEFRYVIDRYKWPESPEIDYIDDDTVGVITYGNEEPYWPIVANLTHGTSSPFPFGERLLQKLQAAFPGMVRGIGPLRLPNFLDLLPIIKSAGVFVSIDTGTLWLSEFLPHVPTIALVNSTHLADSILRRRLDARISYREVRAEPKILIRAIERALKITSVPGWELVGEPARPGKWPEVFLTGEINGQSDIKLRYDAIRAWQEVLEGSEPCMFFDRVMRQIAERLDVKTSDLIEFGGQRNPAKTSPSSHQ